MVVRRIPDTASPQAEDCIAAHSFMHTGLCELRVMMVRNLSGYFDRPYEIVDNLHPNTYWTVNPIGPVPVSNRLDQAVRGGCTSKDMLLKWRNIVVDIDPVRDHKVANKAEHAAAQQKAREIQSYLNEHGIQPLLIDSGNGAYVVIPVDLVTYDDLPRLLLNSLAERFDDDQSKIDVKAGRKISQIFRVPGSLNAKGKSTVDRPHRFCRVIDCPERIDAKRDVLAALCSTPVGYPLPPYEFNEQSMDLDVETEVQRHVDWLLSRGIEHKLEQLPTGTLIRIPCPWKHSTASSNGRTWIYVSTHGVSGGCYHAECGSDIHSLREQIGGWAND